MSDRSRSEKGTFTPENEPRGPAIAIRLPQSLDDWLTNHCQELGIKKSDWLLSVAFNAIQEQTDV